MMRPIDLDFLTACRGNNVKDMERLYKEGANINCEDQFERVPLYHVAFFGNYEAAVWLKNHGAFEASKSLELKKGRFWRRPIDVARSKSCTFPEEDDSHEWIEKQKIVKLLEETND